MNRTKLRFHPTSNIDIGGREIPRKHEVKYLSVTIDRGLTFFWHVNLTRNKARAGRTQLYPLTGKHSRHNINNKMTLIQSVILPILMYAPARLKSRSFSGTCVCLYGVPPMHHGTRIIMTPSRNYNTTNLQEGGKSIQSSISRTCRLRRAVYR